MRKPDYERDGVQLFCGDCLEILPELGKVDAVVTDPPYGIEGTWRGGNVCGWGKFSREAEKWDKRPEKFIDLLNVMDCAKIIWGGHYFGLPSSGSWLVWDKLVREFTSGHCELAWTNLGNPIRAFNYSHGQLATEGKLHPAQKPLPLIEWCLDFIPDAKNIIDPYMGSGTTGVACIRTGRKFIGIELEPKYFEIAVGRIEREFERMPLFAKDQTVVTQSQLFE